MKKRTQLILFTILFILFVLAVIKSSKLSLSPEESDILENNPMTEESLIYPPQATEDLELDPKNPSKMAITLNDIGYDEQGTNVPSEFDFSGQVGAPDNQINIILADWGYLANNNIGPGWTNEERQNLNLFISNMYPLMRQVYGPPAQNYNLTIVKHLYYTTSAIFIPSLDRIYMNQFNPQLLTHELIHAWRGDYILSRNQPGTYNPTLSGFEEGFAQSASYHLMTLYAEQYPNSGTPGVEPHSIWQSSMGWDYDFANVPQLRGTDFWSDYNGLGLAWTRYEVAAATINKMYLENKTFYSDFNKEYYKRLNANPSLIPTREEVISIIETVLPKIEGTQTKEWINPQYTLTCQVILGKKLWISPQNYPSFSVGYWIFNRIYYYETMSCGSEWACLNPTSNNPYPYNYNYHNLNGIIGREIVTNYNGQQISSEELQIEPTYNPPEWYGFGNERLDLTTASTNQPWPGTGSWQYTYQGQTHYTSPAHFVYNMNEFGLYKLYVEFENKNKTSYNVMGDVLKNFKGVYGGILNSNNGRIYLIHTTSPQNRKEPLQLINGAFANNTPWTGIYNQHTHFYDSLPGKVKITYIDQDQNIYLTEKNIDYGSWQGNQLFLLDTKTMKKPDLQLYYKFDQIQGGVTPDSSIYNRNGKLIKGKAYIVNSQLGPVIQFVKNDSVNVTGQDININKDFSVSAWIKLDKKTQETGQPVQTILSDGAGGSWPSLILFTNPDDRVAVKFHYQNTQAGSITLASQTKLQKSKWYHIATKSENDKLYLYINGIKESEINLQGKSPYNSNKNFFIGSNNQGTQWYFNGAMNNLRIYNSSISDEAIYDLYRNP